MLISDERKRYSKQILLPEIGLAGQERLLMAKVLVIGAGGLGCAILPYLTAAGVGLIGVADADVVELSNLQRQTLYSQEDIGQLKADVAIRKMRVLNQLTHVRIHREFVTAANALQILSGYDVIVDGSDNFATRYLVNDACVLLGKPMVSGAIYRYEGQVSVFNYRFGPTYRCLFPEPPGEGESPNCAEIGVVATLPGIIGTIQANEVIKIITGIGEVLSGRLLVMDTLTMNTHIFNFRLVEANRNITELKDDPQYCAPIIKTIDYNALQTLLAGSKPVQLIDVREKEEHEIGNIGGISVPLSLLHCSLHRIDPALPVILYCSSGVRSKHAAKMLLEKGFTDVTNLQNGIMDVPGL